MINFPRSYDNKSRLNVQDLDFNPNDVRKFQSLLSDKQNPYFEPVAADLAVSLAKSGINYDQLEVLVNNIKGVKELNWKHYLMFLLYPSEFPIKVRPPGVMPIPTGTEIRQIRHYASTTITADNNVFKMRFDPLMAGGSVEYARYGQGLHAASSNLTNPFPTNWDTIFNAHRIIAAECKVNIIQSFEESRGKIICSPSGIASGAITAAEFDATNVGNIWDNQFVVETDAVDGCRMIFLPMEERNLFFGKLGDDWSVLGAPGYTRMVWDLIARGLKTGSQIELFFSFYVEAIVSDDYMEIVSTPDSKCPGTSGNISDVINKGGEILRGSLREVVDKREPTPGGGVLGVLDNMSGWAKTATGYISRIMDIGKSFGPLVGTVMSRFGSVGKLLPMLL